MKGQVRGLMDATGRSRSSLFLAVIASCGLFADASLPAAQKVPLPRPRPAVAVTKQPAVPARQTAPLPQTRPQANGGGLGAFAQANVGLHGALLESRTEFKPLVRPASGPFAVAPHAATAANDVAAVKRVIEAARKGKDSDANAAEATISDPVARKLAEWVILRSDNTNPSFERYAAFVQNNPAWPHVPLFRRRAENALWNDGVDAAAVRTFFAKKTPSTAKGRYMLARILLAQGDRDGAAGLVRYAWRHEDCSAEVEKKVLEMFGGMLTIADHKIRMETRFYAGDAVAGLRAAERLGGNELVIARARVAVLQKARNAKALLDAVPAAAQHEPGYIFARVQWLRQNNKPGEGGDLILTAPKDPEALVDLDQWWLERRLLVRKLLDQHNPQAAYNVAREAAPPMRGVYRVDAHFTAGWVALRYLHNPKAAAQHFAHIM